MKSRGLEDPEGWAAVALIPIQLSSAAAAEVGFLLRAGVTDCRKV